MLLIGRGILVHVVECLISYWTWYTGTCSRVFFCIFLQEYKEEFLTAWRAQSLDVVICPPFATTAVPHGNLSDLLGKVLK